MFTRSCFLISAVIFTLCVNSIQAQADTFLVPEEFTSVTEAVAASSAGDAISISGEANYEWIHIHDTELTLQARAGSSPQLVYYWGPFSPGKGSINIENASITIDGFTVHSSYQASLIVADSNLTIRNSVLYGRSYNFSRYNVSASAQPALLWQNAFNRTLKITQSQLLGGNGNEAGKSAALTIANCSQSSVFIQQALLQGADRARTWQRILPTSNAALYVYNSTGVSVYASECELSGGQGYDAAVTRPDLPTIPYLPHPPYYGSSAVVIDNSNIEIHEMICRAGSGGDGGDLTVLDENQVGEIHEHFDGANGAVGLQALEGSYVILRNCDLRGGAGGLPSGQPGEPYIADASSTVNIINDSSVQDWALH